MDKFEEVKKILDKRYSRYKELLAHQEGTAEEICQLFKPSSENKGGEMSWQKCPVCNGVGTVSGGYFTRAGDYTGWTSYNSTETCRTCGGKGIIDEITGLPPNEKIKEG